MPGPFDPATSFRDRFVSAILESADVTQDVANQVIDAAKTVYVLFDARVALVNTNDTLNSVTVVGTQQSIGSGSYEYATFFFPPNGPEYHYELTRLHTKGTAFLIFYKNEDGSYGSNKVTRIEAS